MDAPTTPGDFLFTDQPGNTQPVQIELIDGELCARFEDMELGDAPVPVKDMAGTWKIA